MAVCLSPAGLGLALSCLCLTLSEGNLTEHSAWTLLDGAVEETSIFTHQDCVGENKEPGCQVSGSRNCLRTLHILTSRGFLRSCFSLVSGRDAKRKWAAVLSVTWCYGWPLCGSLGSGRDHLSPRLGSRSGIQRLLKGVVHTSSGAVQSLRTQERFYSPKSLQGSRGTGSRQ